MTDGRQVSLRQLGNKIRKFKVESNDILLIREDAEIIQSQREIDFLEEHFRKAKISNVAVIVVKDISDIRGLPEGEMNKFGWFRIEHLRNLIFRGKTEEKEENG